MGNPGDKYTLYKLTTDPVADLANINAMADAGFEVKAVLPYPGATFVLMGDYQGS